MHTLLALHGTSVNNSSVENHYTYPTCYNLTMDSYMTLGKAVLTICY